MYGVRECYHCKSVPNKSEPAGAASVPWPWQCSSISDSPFLSPPSAPRAKRVHHVRAVHSVITAALVLTGGYSANLGVQVHSSQIQTQKSSAIAASSSLSITTPSRQSAISAHWASRGSLPICSLCARSFVSVCPFGASGRVNYACKAAPYISTMRHGLLYRHSVGVSWLA
jgi:hypothetical protein